MYNYLTYIDNFPIGDRKLIYDFFFFFCYSQKFSNSIIFVLLYILIY